MTRVDFKDPKRPDLGVVLIASIKAKYDIPDNAEARIYGAVFGFGQGKVNIVAGPSSSGGRMLDRVAAKIPGDMAPTFGEFLTKDFTDSVERAVDNIGKLAEKTAPVAENLSKLLEQRPAAQVDAPDAAQKGMIANISTVVERVDKLVAHLDKVVGDEKVQSDVKGITRDLKTTSEDLHKLVQLWTSESQKLANNVNDGIDNTEERIAQSLRNLNEVLGKLDDSADHLASVLQAIDQGKGTAGLLVRDERLYEALTLAFSNIAEVAATVQRIAGKVEEDGYITLAQKTVVGTLTKDFPVGTKNEESK